MQRKNDVALALMRSHVRAPQLAHLVAPQIYLRASLSVLSTARRLYRAGVIGRSGLARALQLSNALSRTAHASWRRRCARSRARAA